ncbi:carboxypeptidase-like regulatory domain-containing protein [Chryseobacterium carnipullorum]|uniref:carboxypeptidase-like regulatory domain-containing protein n=1 Tax=Chryseobacterium carnipullorum TaxID=1124835 RepID=UPI000934A705|nr:carboxypeptidase-like regulatory domain-containing protein [Chryseobacterium carnipullorum]
MKLKLLFFLTSFFFIHLHAQNYIFGKVISEDNAEIQEVTVINIRTDERGVTNRDGHFMVSGRAGDELRFVKAGYERIVRRVSKENIESPLNITLARATILIPEVEIKQGLTGDLKIDTKNLNRPKKVDKLIKDMDRYIAQKSDPRILAAKPGEFVQPKGQGFFIGKVKNKWDDIDLISYLHAALGDDYFTNLKIEKPQIEHFINYVLAGGFERQKILKYGFCSDADLNRFQRFVLTRISSYRAPKTQR